MKEYLHLASKRASNAPNEAPEQRDTSLQEKHRKAASSSKLDEVLTQKQARLEDQGGSASSSRSPAHRVKQAQLLCAMNAFMQYKGFLLNLLCYGC